MNRGEMRKGKKIKKKGEMIRKRNIEKVRRQCRG